MKNYKMEGNIDFFAELYKSLDSDAEHSDEDDNVCLITNEPLIENFVKLNCGHSFNYLPLYKDLMNHKNKFNNMESSATVSNHNEIRCPYCRKKQTELLPYYDMIGVKKIHGVNYFDLEKINNKYSTHSYYNTYQQSCKFCIPNELYDPSGNSPVEFVDYSTQNINGKYIKCTNYGSKINFGSINLLNTANIQIQDTNHYCYTHKRIMIRKYKNDIASKEKEKIKMAKEKVKDEKLLIKEKEKQEKLLAKEEKKKEKELNKTPKKKTSTKKNIKDIQNMVNEFIGEVEENNSNIVLGPSDIQNTLTLSEVCQEILKTGLKKGQQCGCQIFDKETSTCKRHYNMNNKSNATNM